MIRSRFAPVCIGLLLAGPVPSGRAGAEDRVDFARDIRLILARNCYECHGPEKQQLAPRLDREADAAERPRLPPRSPLEALKAVRLHRRRAGVLDPFHFAASIIMNSVSRRGFLKTAAAAGSVCPLFTIAGTKSSGRVLGANDAIRVGVAGIHGQGNAHIDQYLGLEGRAGHLPDRPRHAACSNRAGERSGTRAATSRSACRTSARRWRTRTSTRSRSPRRTTGIR